jgi:hypothetical protein
MIPSEKKRRVFFGNRDLDEIVWLVLTSRAEKDGTADPTGRPSPIFAPMAIACSVPADTLFLFSTPGRTKLAATTTTTAAPMIQIWFVVQKLELRVLVDSSARWA